MKLSQLLLQTLGILDSIRWQRNDNIRKQILFMSFIKYNNYNTHKVIFDVA